MPRSTLPSALKKLETIDILLTQTTEEDVWGSLKMRYDIFMSRKEHFAKKISTYVGIFLDSNVYASVDLNKPIERSYRDNIFAFTEQEQTEYQQMFSLKHDFELCKRVLDWNETKPEFEEMLWELQKFQLYASTSMSDVEALEDSAYRTICTKKKTIAMEKLNAEKVTNPHKFHTSINDWNILFKENSDAWTWHGGSEQTKYNESLQCLKCQEIEAKRVQFDKIVEDIQEIKQDIKDALQEHKEATAIVEYTCEDCDFKTHVKYLHTGHMHSTEHKRIQKLKEWFCEKCNSQSRTQVEWDNHIQTNKHLNKNDSTDHVCEKCNYSTKLKHLFTQHCATKKHLEA